MPFPDLVGLWTAMENKEPWYPTFPAGYALTPKAAYRGGVSTRLTPWNNPLARWPTSEASFAPVLAAAETVAPTLKAEQARRSGGQGGGGKPGRGSGGIGGVGEGAKERLNAMAYNKAYVKGRLGPFLACRIDATHHPQG